MPTVDHEMIEIANILKLKQKKMLAIRKFLNPPLKHENGMFQINPNLTFHVYNQLTPAKHYVQKTI